MNGDKVLKPIDAKRVIAMLGGDENGSIVEGDVKLLRRACLMVFYLLSDEQWHEGVEFRSLAIGDPMRRLRQLGDAYGLEIERDRIPGSQGWRYRWTGLVEERVFDLEAYYRSPKWWALKRAVGNRDGWACRGCGARKNLVCHHKSYKRLGREPLDDLVTLCSKCHEIVHEFGLRREHPLALSADALRMPKEREQATLFG